VSVSAGLNIKARLHSRAVERAYHVNSPSCKDFYKPTDPGFRGDTFANDERGHMFRPIQEVSSSNTRQKDMPTYAFKRMLTYEDLAVPVKFNEAVAENRHCLQFAVHTPQRPVKVLSATSSSGQTLTMPAVWKVASTSFANTIQHSPDVTQFSDYHNIDVESRCRGRNTLKQCERHTSFDTDATAAKVKALVVRNPLDRFLASVYEHGTWSLCDGQLCEYDLQNARKVASHLAGSFPGRWHSCEHPSQSYFLSATDLYGEPYKWDLIMRLEDLDDGIKELNRLTGMDLSSVHKNDSGSADPDMVFDAVFKDLATLCAVCKVYAQDFTCFDYALPANCTQEQCATVGIDLTEFRDV